MIIPSSFSCIVLFSKSNNVYSWFEVTFKCFVITYLEGLVVVREESTAEIAASFELRVRRFEKAGQKVTKHEVEEFLTELKAREAEGLDRGHGVLEVV